MLLSEQDRSKPAGLIAFELHIMHPFYGEYLFA